MIIESKDTTFDIGVAMPQALAYMAGALTHSLPLFGLITNGTSYIFLKLVAGQPTQYAFSASMSLISPDENVLYRVLQILKRLVLTVQEDSPSE